MQWTINDYLAGTWSMSSSLESYSGSTSNYHAECTAFRAAGASLMGVHWMHSTRPEDLRDSAGCTASFEFPPVYDS